MRRKIHRRDWMKETEVGSDVTSKDENKTKYFETAGGYPSEKTLWVLVLTSGKSSLAGQPSAFLGVKF